jgi:hypothetical protein
VHLMSHETPRALRSLNSKDVSQLVYIPGGVGALFFSLTSFCSQKHNQMMTASIVGSTISTACV